MSSILIKKNKETSRNNDKIKKNKKNKNNYRNKNKDNIIVFCAHSDDQIFGPGGTLAKYAMEGKKIYTYIMSYGEKSSPLLKDEITIEKRVKESQEADKIIGGSGVFFFGLKEGHFYEDYLKKKLNEKISKILVEKKPEKIFIHSIDDPHPDHKAVYKIITSLVEILNLNTEVYTFDVWNPFTIRKRDSPKLYVDISKTFKIKLKALSCFKSQKISLIALLWSVYLRGFLNGLKCKKLVAEKFIRVI